MITHIEVWLSETGCVVGTDDPFEFIHRNNTPDIILAGKQVTYWVWVESLLYAPTRRMIIDFCNRHYKGQLKRVQLDLTTI